MKGDIIYNRKSKGVSQWWIQLAMVGGFAVILLLGIAIAASALSTNPGEPTIATNGGAISNSISCAGATMPGLTAEKYDWIKHAASRYLTADYTNLTNDQIKQILSSKNYRQESSGGDEAGLIAVLWEESGFSPIAISDTGASGMGQFTYRTAFGTTDKPGFPEFVGGPDIYGGPAGDGVPWDGGPKFTIPGNTGTDAASRANFYNTLSTDQQKDMRFGSQGSIYAAAHYLGNLMRTGGDVVDAYAGEYSGHNVGAAQKVRNKYNELKSGGGCDTLNIIPPSVLSSGKISFIDFVGNSRGTVIGQITQTSNPISAVDYWIWRAKDSSLAQKVNDEAYGFYNNNSTDQNKLLDAPGYTNWVLYSHSTKQCKTLVYDVLEYKLNIKLVNGHVAIGKYGALKPNQVPPSDQFTQYDKRQIPPSQVQPGDIFHFTTSPYSPGFSEHWAIAVATK